jgi:GrpB-like predicted nucleotidyltransferase (UPF0157 family)
MNRFGILAVVLVTLPFFLIPAFAARKNGKRSANLFLVLNLLITLFLPFGLGGVLAAMSGSISSPAIGTLPLALVIALWLTLLHFSLRKDAPTAQDIDEAVTLVGYDASWPDSFAAERQRLTQTLSLPETSIEHIGSTAVPGMTAKPVVDMMLGVDHYPPAHDLLSRLSILGYEHLGEAGVAGRRYLRLREAGRDFNLHVVARDGEHWKNNLAFRELLRTDSPARERYTEGKARALEAGGTRLNGYSAAKQAVVSELLAAARAR